MCVTFFIRFCTQSLFIVMYSGGWEVVSKNKKDKTAAATKNGKLSKADKKKFIENAPKVEDFCEFSRIEIYCSRLTYVGERLADVFVYFPNVFMS